MNQGGICSGAELSAPGHDRGKARQELVCPAVLWELFCTHLWPAWPGAGLWGGGGGRVTLGECISLFYFF